MRRLISVVLLVGAALAPRAAHAGNETWEILESGWTNVSVSTAQVSNGGAILLAVANSSRMTSLITNEGSIDIRIGPSTVSSTIGLLVKANTTVNLDSPLVPFRGAIYAYAVSSSSSNVSMLQGTQ